MAPPVVVLSESRYFQLDFAWVDFAFSCTLYCILFMKGKNLVLKSGNWFGLFAFWADYVLYYMIQGTRTIEYPTGSQKMTAFGDFCFFFWFDLINGADIVMWALLVLEDLLVPVKKAAGGREAWEWAVLAFIPLWFWSTPPLSRYLSIDDRTLLVTRPSEKYKYWVLMGVFVTLMRLRLRMPLRHIGRVLASGVGCGLIHHAPLFFFGMRGYSSPFACVLTLLTEWPAIMSGLFFITASIVGYTGAHDSDKAARRCARVAGGDGAGGAGGGVAPSRRALVVPVAAIVAACAVGPNVRKIDGDDIMYALLPHLPAPLFQRIGTAYVHLTTCALPRLSAPTPCGKRAGELWVMAAAPKGGAVFSAQVAMSAASECGLCVASGQREHGRWPGPVEDLPTYEGDMLLAMCNMRTWPQYARRHGLRPRCNLILRDPLTRLRSLYLYARIGGEKWFRDEGIDRELAAQTNTTVSVGLFWERFGRGYLANSHAYLVESLAEGCRAWQMESFAEDYNATARAMFAEGWGVADDAVLDRLVEVASEHDMGRRSEAELRGDHHHTSSKVTSGLKHAVEAALKGMPEVMRMVQDQREVLGYVQ